MHSFVDILENSKNVKKKINTETEVYSASLQTPHKLKDYYNVIKNINVKNQNMCEKSKYV